MAAPLFFCKIIKQTLAQLKQILYLCGIEIKNNIKTKKIMIYSTVKTIERAKQLVEEYATLSGCTIVSTDATYTCHCECGETKLYTVDAMSDPDNGTMALKIECAICDSCGDDELEASDVIRSYAFQIRK